MQALIMLTEEQKRQIDKMSIVDIIDHLTVPQILSYIDPLHAVVVYGWRSTLDALERYEKHSSK